MKKTLPLLLLISFSAFSQRTIPYPIILIHGFHGDGGAYWATLNSYFKNAGLTIEPNQLSFNLNADGNEKTSNKDIDVIQYPISIGNNDVYAVNFDTGVLSNQSGAVKQGFALKFAIQQVLSATRAKKVILLGHSMGGLAAREYLQNPSNWQSDGQHRLAKLVTLGTPHGGSNVGSDGLNLGNLFFGYDEKSEAVRDLRTDYKTGRRGVYLFGGYESSQYIQRGSFGGSYYNLDVDCNGREGDYIVGLNEKSISTDLAYACIVGRGVGGIYGDSDGVVLAISQTLSLTNYPVDLYYHQCQLGNINCHTNEPKEALLPIMHSLDEPETGSLAYEIDVTKSQVGRGFFNQQVNGSQTDTDRYKFFVGQGGVLSFAANGYQDALSRVILYNGNGQVVTSWQGPSINTSIRLTSAGTYFIDFTGSSKGTWTSYVYNTSFCPLPDYPTIITSGATTFCEGQSITLSTNSQLDNYTWLKDGAKIGGNSNSIVVSQSGNYLLNTSACGYVVTSANAIIVKVNALPAQPTITVQNQPFGLLATGASNYQWYRNGQKIDNATQALLTGVSSGAYTVKTTVQGCTSESQPFVVTGTEQTDNRVNIYPNPSPGTLTIELPVKAIATIELTDLTGKTVFSITDTVKSSTKSVDVHSLANGFYTLKVRYEDREESHKIAIQQ